MKKGARVRVSYTGTFVSESTKGTTVEDDAGVTHWYNKTLGMTIEVTDPKGWPVQAGDIWKVGDKEYVILKNSDDLIASPVEDYGPMYGRRYANSMQDLKELGPVLVRRR